MPDLHSRCPSLQPSCARRWLCLWSRSSSIKFPDSLILFMDTHKYIHIYL
ncbi:hypothetical protein LOK49_LG02G01373 [Camellia lanceoleosa]|uniref:Uncharacterized protein n=1 Tax=Camellia lanceoleosa TaxID=1840588 RepID=A0ACC0INP2_9ERIC|nr:hypothetical protein LOK49_LG02G01373 [Camellia lanceoleosa]